jgi:hypothetical protein
MIRSRDKDETDLLDAVRLEAVKVMDDLQTNLARKIAKEHADAQNRGMKNKG